MRSAKRRGRIRLAERAYGASGRRRGLRTTGGPNDHALSFAAGFSSMGAQVTGPL
jgi:hypothetical protein